MGKKKGNKDEPNGDVDEVVEENATSASKDASKKAKKGKKKKDADWEDTVAKELEDMTLEESGGKEEDTPEPEPIPEKKDKKKDKKVKKAKVTGSDSEEGEVIVKSKKGGGFAALMDEGDDDLSDGDEDEPVIEVKKDKKKQKKEDKPKPVVDDKNDKKKGKKAKGGGSDSEEGEVIVKSKKGGGFAALMDEGDDDDLSDDDIGEPVIEIKKDKKKNKKEDKPKPVVDDKNDKKKGKKGKKKKNDEEDLDQILAELELEYKGEKTKEETKNTEEAPQPAEETGKKKKKKKKDTSVEPEPAEKIDTPAEKIDTPAEKIDTPAEKIDTPAEKIDTPAEKIDTPAEKIDTPAEKIDTPAEKIDTPAEKIDTPAEKIDVPAEKVDTSGEKIDIPSKKIDAAADKTSTPEEMNGTPSVKVDAPAKAEPKDASVAKAEPEDASVAKAEPKDASIAKAEPEDASVAEAEPKDASIAKAEPEDASVAEAEPKEASAERTVNDKEVPKDNEGNAKEEPAKPKKKKKKAKDAAAAQAEDSKEGTPVPDEQGEGNAEGEEEGAGKKKKKKKKDKEAEEEEKSRKGKPSKKALAVMREILAKQKEEEERQRKEEEERIRQEEERIRQLEEEKRIDQEKKERKKQREKERKERLKAEGKLLTPKQKAEQKRAQEMLEHLKAQGVILPEAGEKRPRPGTKIKTKKQKKEEKPVEVQEEPAPVVEPEPMEVVTAVEEVKEEEIEVKDAWDETSDEDDDEEEDTSEATKTSQDTDSKKTGSDRKDGEDEEEDDDDSKEDADTESEESVDEHKNEAEKRKERAVTRMAKRKEENLKNLEPDILRAPVVCVLGHVDHGKTKILDKLRKTNVQEGEVGGITQQIGATNVPADAIRKQTHMVKDFDMDSLKFPGLLIIDTPGHESFRNLRSRGSSLCDIAILVVDVTQGLEPQTRESVSLLRKKSTPFIVALNKVDRVYEWDPNPAKDIREIIMLQEEPSKNDFERRTAQVIQGLREEKLNSALFWENPNPKEYISLVPTSAISGDGMGNLIALICNLCQQRLKKNLMFSEELQCTVLEVKTIQGHGTTIDVILVNGRLREGDTMIVAGTEGPIVTQIRSLLLPKPLKEIRVKGQYDEFKEISAAQGVKIAARDLEKAIAGLSLKVAYHEDEIDIIKEEIDKEFKAAMRSIKVKDRGVYVQASTLGALEALLEFFKSNDVPYSGIRVGPVVKRDVMKAAAMLEHDPMYAVILAFDVKVEKDAQELADKEGVKIFSEETIYHLGDRYVDYLKDYKKKKQDEFRTVAVFPSRLKIIPTAIFNKRDPIVLGVTVDAGILRTGTPLCVPAKEFVEIGIVTSMEFDHKNVDIAKKGVDVCIKIEPVPGHTPKLFGRHFEAEDALVSKISRESINACKDHFRDDLSKTDWKLMAELKKQFQIL